MPCARGESVSASSGVGPSSELGHEAVVAHAGTNLKYAPPGLPEDGRSSPP